MLTAILLASIVFASVAFAFGTPRWALGAIARFVPTVSGIAYFRYHPREPLGIAALGVTLAVASTLLWMRRRSRRAA